MEAQTTELAITDPSFDWYGFLWEREAASHHTFECHLATGGIRTVRVAQNLDGARCEELGSADGLHTTVWEAAVALYLLVDGQPERWRGKKVLELGAGTGVVGLVLAAHGADVTLTDLPEALPILRHNAAANFEPGTPEAERVRVLPLDWTQGLSPALRQLQPFDVVVGADLVYNEALYAPLLDTLDRVCTAGMTQCYLARLVRGAVEGPRRFHARLRRSFDVVPAPPIDEARFAKLADTKMKIEMALATPRARDGGQGPGNGGPAAGVSPER